MVKFLAWKGRFPRARFELPDDAIEHLARQVKVPAAEIGAYDFAGRQIRNHRREVRCQARSSLVADAGLEDQIEIRVADYRELVDEPFDAVASIGMIEHGGARQLGIAPVG